MTYAKTESFPPAGRAPEASNAAPRAGQGLGRIRLVLGLAAVLALAVWGLMSDGTTEAPDLRSANDTASTEAKAEQGPVFDGRGKWGGYAR